jgi:methyl-accepting chemotaxis protein
MAVVGDVMIKAALDVADVKTGVDQANQELKRLNDTTESISKSAALLAGSFNFKLIYDGVKQVVDAMIQYADQVQKTVAAIGDLANKYGMTTDAVQAYSRAAADANLKQEQVLNSVQRFNNDVDKAVAGQARYIQAFKDLGVHVLDNSGKQRSYNELLEESATRLLKMEDGTKKANAGMVLFDQNGDKLNSTLKILATPIDDLTQKFKDLGEIHGPEVVKQMQDLEARSEKAGKQIEVFFAPIIASVKTGVLEALANGINNIKTIIGSIDIPTWAKVAAILAAIANPAVGAALLAKVFGDSSFGANLTGAASASNMSSLTEQITRTQGIIDANKALMDKAQQGSKQWQDAAKQVADQTRLLEQTKATLDQTVTRNINTSLGGVPDSPGRPDFGPTGGQDPTPRKTTTTTGRGGGGGGSVRIENQIETLRLQTEAANKATADLLAQTDKPLEDIQREVEQQKKVDDLVARIQVQLKGKDTSRAQEIARSFVVAEEGYKNLLEYSKKAEDQDKRSGDGTKQRTSALNELNKMMATGRLSNEAYAKSVKDINEQYEQTNENSRRAQGGFEAFTAGVENAARSMKKSTDEFSQGQQVFNQTMDFMSNAFSDLVFNAGKSFDQILADFGKFLANMAFKAAASQIFNAFMGTAGAAAGGATGGGFLSVISSWFGGNRASGGPVQPGQSYIVGESGPERFVPTAAGEIKPYSSVSTGDVNVNVNMVQGEGQQSFKQTTDFARKIKQAVVDTINNEKRPGGTLYRRA